jgi:hypothetical protein
VIAERELGRARGDGGPGSGRARQWNRKRPVTAQAGTGGCGSGADDRVARAAGRPAEVRWAHRVGDRPRGGPATSELSQKLHNELGGILAGSRLRAGYEFGTIDYGHLR